MRKTLPMNLQFFAEGGADNGGQDNAGGTNNNVAGQNVQNGQNSSGKEAYEKALNEFRKEYGISWQEIE